MVPASQQVARRYLRKQAAIVGTDTAVIYALAPEMLRHVTEERLWWERWFRGDYDGADQVIRQHGGAVFYTGADGRIEVIVPGAEDRGGAMYPYGTEDFTTEFFTKQRTAAQRVGTRYLRKQADQDEFLLPFPEARQSTDFSCGAAATQAVLYYYGHEYREEQLVSALGTTTEGTDAGAIVRVLLGAKLSVYAGRMGLGHVKWCLRQGFPVILAIQAWGEAVAEENRQAGYDRNQDGHYVVAIGYKDGQILCEDPSILGHRGAISEAELDERWHDEEHGIVLDHFGIVAMGTPQYDPHLVRHIKAVGRVTQRYLSAAAPLSNAPLLIIEKDRLEEAEDEIRTLMSEGQRIPLPLVKVLGKSKPAEQRVLLEWFYGLYPEKRPNFDAPLTAEEKKDIAKANVFVMDWEMDGGHLPPEVEKLNNLKRKLTPREDRVVLDWFYSTASASHY